MELDNIKVEFYSALGKPKGSQTELENEIAGNDNDFYCVFIASFPWFADNKKSQVWGGFSCEVFDCKELFENSENLMKHVIMSGFYCNTKKIEMADLCNMSNTRFISYIESTLCVRMSQHTVWYTWILYVCGKNFIHIACMIR